MDSKRPHYMTFSGQEGGDKFGISNGKRLERKVIPTHYAGNLTCYVQDDLTKPGGKVTFVTLHDTNTNHRAFVPFINSPYMDRVRERARFIHLVMPGHDAGDTLYVNDEYPTCDEIAHDVNDVLDALNIKTCICIGEGAGANILCRFTLQYPNRCLGLVAIDLRAHSAGYQEYFFQTFGGMPNGGKWLEKAKHIASGVLYGGEGSSGRIPGDNMQLYERSYFMRTDLKDLLKNGLNSEVLLISGQYSRHVDECRAALRLMDKRHTTFMQFDKTNNILEERHEQLARALVLFSKACGVLLGVPMFGLEAAFAKVAKKVQQTENEHAVCKVTEDIARRMMSHERRLEKVLDGEQ